MLRCDLHIHSNFSRDGESTIEEILARALEVGLDAIAITDHDTVEGALYAMTLHTPVLVIPGIEISTRQGHLIALGITRPVPPDLDFLKTEALVKEMGGLTILPHPYHQWRHGAALKVRAAIEAVDAVEVFNSRYIIGSANWKAEKRARSLNKPCVAGSDAHNARFVGYGQTLIDAEEPTVDAILRAILEGKTSIEGRMTPLSTYALQSIKGAERKIKRRVQE
jgi:predicted metal-dependent phosphoesterase TrpH